MKNILVIGLGYVGLAFSLLLSDRHNVTCVDIDKDKIDKLNKGISPINTDEFISNVTQKRINNMRFTTSLDNLEDVFDIAIIATPTDYDEIKDCFNVASVTSVINTLKAKQIAKNIIIKSTIPVGYTASFDMDNLYFSPEFLKEDKAISDILYPSRIILGGKKENKELLNVFIDLAINKDVDTLFTTSSEAEAIKLFSNAFLALRISFFNEVDTFALEKNMDTSKIIKGICLDKRIGDYYNNPSFGYGGYCLPKDTKQLKSNFKDIPSSLINAIVDANKVRKEYILKVLSKTKKDQTLGIYRLSMKKGSDNYRNSSINDIIINLIKDGYKVIVYEPNYDNPTYLDATINNDLDSFKKEADIIIANRVDEKLSDVTDKIFTRDIFSRD